MEEDREEFLEQELDYTETEEEGSEFYEHLNIVVDKNQEPLRIDKFLLIFRQNSSRNKISQTCRAGNVIVNGTPVKQNYRVKPGDQVRMEVDIVKIKGKMGKVEGRAYVGDKLCASGEYMFALV